MPAGYRVRMIRRPLRTVLAGLTVGATVVLGGCTTPSPDPTPTSTGFADEAAAFAAAEATYRAYVDALNRVDLADPATFEDVYALTTGELNASDREGLSRYHAEGFNVSGSSIIESVSGEEWTPDLEETSLNVCLNVSSVEVQDVSGESQVQPDRVAVQSLLITVVGASPDALLISDISGREDGPSCGP
jgi:hypothetical protein